MIKFFGGAKVDVLFNIKNTILKMAEYFGLINYIYFKLFTQMFYVL